jgi:hypothetical protein
MLALLSVHQHNQLQSAAGMQQTLLVKLDELQAFSLKG